MDTHRIQDMHLLLSETLRLSVEMALAGHFSAHCPQDVQAEPAFGIIPDPAFFVWSVAGNRWLGKIIGRCFFENLLTEFCKDFVII